MGSVSGRRKAALLWIMLTALIVLEAADVAMMAMHGQIPGRSCTSCWRSSSR